MKQYSKKNSMNNNGMGTDQDVTIYCTFKVRSTMPVILQPIIYPLCLTTSDLLNVTCYDFFAFVRGLLSKTVCLHYHDETRTRV